MGEREGEAWDCWEGTKSRDGKGKETEDIGVGEYGKQTSWKRTFRDKKISPKAISNIL